MSARIFYLWYSPDSGRYMRQDYGLHCGDCLTAMVNSQWVETRVEHSASSTHSHGWFLVTHPEQPLDDLPVKEAL